MSITNPLTKEINSLTAQINEVTNISNTNLKDAVNTLIDNYSMSGFEKVGEYTVSESWEDDNKGNPIQIIKTVLIDGAYLSEDKNYLFLLTFVGNSASETSYKVDEISVPFVGISSNLDWEYDLGYCLRNNRTAVRKVNIGTSSWASQGTTINIYRHEL